MKHHLKMTAWSNKAGRLRKQFATSDETRIKLREVLAEVAKGERKVKEKDLNDMQSEMARLNKLCMRLESEIRKHESNMPRPPYCMGSLA